MVNREAKRNTITPFLYPAVWLAKNQDYYNSNVTDKDNPIGSILAFAGIKKDKPDGWEVCDGAIKKVADYPQLFRIIGFRWGKGANDEEFRIPNLQGLFLRGMDYDGIHDPEAKTRPNSAGELGEVGSYQRDTFITHAHQVAQGFGAYKDQDDYNNAGFVVNHGTAGAKEATTSWSGEGETRPKNVAVNYIIRTI